MPQGIRWWVRDEVTDFKSGHRSRSSESEKATARSSTVKSVSRESEKAAVENMPSKMDYAFERTYLCTRKSTSSDERKMTPATDLLKGCETLVMPVSVMVSLAEILKREKSLATSRR